MAKVDEIEQGYLEAGATQEFAQEYMVQSEDPAVKAFTSDMFKVEPTVRTWHATYSMYDPARTVKTTSATTGVVHFSWIANRLIVWDAYGPKWKPDEIIADMFRADDLYAPVTIGVERDGLEEFILQPLRQEQVRRAYAIPIRPMKAPKGKLDFIRSMQPFFKAGEVIFAKDLPELRAQLLGFPTGLIDIPNALAYAMILRPGQPIYDGFSYLNIAEEIYKLPRQPMYLAVNATQMYTTAVLVQVNDGVFNVLWDAVREGDPGAVLGGIVADVGLEAGQRPRFYGAPEHFGNYDTVGLRGAARKIPVDLSQGGLGLDGRDEIRALFRRQIRSGPALKVSQRARWTLNAFSGGYCKSVLKNGILSEFADEGPYRTLMEGLESCGWRLKMGQRGGEQPHRIGKPHPMDDDTSVVGSQGDDEENDDVSGRLDDQRSRDISKRAGVSKQLLEMFDEIEQGFSDQSERSDDLVDYWDVYNCKLTGRQFYDGNSKIFVPIVHNAVDARKTRFTNQIFPSNGRNVEVTSSDGEVRTLCHDVAAGILRQSRPDADQGDARAGAQRRRRGSVQRLCRLAEDQAEDHLQGHRDPDDARRLGAQRRR